MYIVQQVHNSFTFFRSIYLPKMLNYQLRTYSVIYPSVSQAFWTTDPYLRNFFFTARNPTSHQFSAQTEKITAYKLIPIFSKGKTRRLVTEKIRPKKGSTSVPNSMRSLKKKSSHWISLELHGMDYFFKYIRLTNFVISSRILCAVVTDPSLGNPDIQPTPTKITVVRCENWKNKKKIACINCFKI